MTRRARTPVCLLLAAFLAAAASLRAQDTQPASQPEHPAGSMGRAALRPVTLPVADQALASGGLIIALAPVASVFHREACPVYKAGGVCRQAAHWAIAIGERTWPMTPDGLAALAGVYRAGAAQSRPVREWDAPPSLPLLIRADAAAPWEFVQPLVDGEISAGRGRLAVAARVSVPASSRGRDPNRGDLPAHLPCPQPIVHVNADGSTSQPATTDEIRVQLIDDPRIGGVQMSATATIGGERSERALPSTAGATRVFEKWLLTLDAPESPASAAASSQPALASPRIRATPVVLDIAPGVPWQRVVDVINACRRIGIATTVFALPPPPTSRPAGDSRPASRATSQPVIGTVAARERSSRGTAFRRRFVPVAKSLDAAADWLVRHQHADGFWGAASFVDACAAAGGKPCTGTGSPRSDVGVTGLAVLALLAVSDDSPVRARAAESAARGVAWLRQQVESTSGLVPESTPESTYSLFIAAEALADAALLTPDAAVNAAAERLIATIVAACSASGGWRYGVRPQESDGVATGWALHALLTARRAHLDVDARAIAGGYAMLADLTDKKTGRTGYLQTGAPPFRTVGTRSQWPESASEAPTALALAARLEGPIISGGARGDKLVSAGAALLMKHLPVWDADGHAVDAIHWRFGSITAHELGGGDADRWLRALHTAVLHHQQTTGCARGSWDAADPFGGDGGRIYMTAMIMLALETPYRSPRTQ